MVNRAGLQTHAILRLLLISALLSGCSGGAKPEAPLPQMKGTIEVIQGTVPLSTLSIPTSGALPQGLVLQFSPVEFPGSQVRLRWEGIKQPVGQTAAVRIVGEGVLSAIPEDHVKTLLVRYRVPFDSLKQARAHFPDLRESQLLKSDTGSAQVEVLNWSFRLVILPAGDAKAFRVMADSLHYYHPASVAKESDDPLENDSAPKATRTPVLIGFFYRYPQYEAQASQQHNVIFDYTIDSKDGSESVGKPQLSNWIPLQPDSHTAPYSIEIAVAEITSEPEKFLPVLRDFIKGVKDIL